MVRQFRLILFLAGLKIYLVTLATTSATFSLSHPILYLLLTIRPSFDEILSNCTFEYNITSALGVQK